MAKPYSTNAKGTSLTAQQSIYDESSTQKNPLGARIELSDGRVFRYAYNGAVALLAGKVCQSAANGGSTTVQKNMAVSTAGVVGGDTVSITAITDAHVVNKFRGGYLSIYDGSAAQGVGQTYRVKSNAVATAGGTFQVVTYDDLKIAISTSAKASIGKHPYDEVIILPSTPTGIVVGVPLIAVTINYYFWLQTWGPCTALADGTWAFATGLCVSDATPGALEPVAGDLPEVGYAMNDAATTKYGLVYLQIAQ